MGQGPSLTVLTGPLIDPKTGRLSHAAFILFLQWQQQLGAGFDPSGNLKSNLLPTIGIVGRLGTIGSILQYIDKNGVVLSDGLTSATDAEQGAVVLPAGATSNTLGSAAIEPSTAFDPAGAAASAQAAAEGHADAVAATAQNNAEAFASNASNLSSGMVDIGLLPGIDAVIVTAALTPTGTQGSMTFINGVLTAQVPAT